MYIIFAKIGVMRQRKINKTKKRDKDMPNQTTIKAIQELETGKAIAFSSVEDLIRDLNG